MDFETARRHMVECQLRPNRVTDDALLAAMGAIPREAFLPESLQPMAYVDVGLEITPGRRTLEPLVLARMIQAAAPTADDVALVVGGGSGYAAALLAKLCDTVFSLESDSELSARASRVLAELSLDNAVTVEGPLREGWPKEAPYNVILVDGGVDVLPDTLLSQLAPGGRLVAVLFGEDDIGRAVLVQRGPVGVSHRPLFDAAASRLPDFGKEAGFVF